jgi:hypothetical protein
MKILIREPLFHFLLLGCLFFLVYQLLAEGAGDEATAARRVEVDAARMQALAAQFQKTWQRAPTDTELERLVESYVREEIYYREALALGLDQNDPVVRRRLQQKLQFITDDMAVIEQPDDGELQQYLDANPDLYRRPSVYSFVQVYLNPEVRGERLVADAEALLAGLRDASVDASAAGDPTLLQPSFRQETGRYIARALGQRFVEQLDGLPTASWQGPLQSGYGLHLVYLEERVEGAMPPLAEVRDAVLRDWNAQKRRQLNDDVYQEFRKRYEVVVDPAGAAAATGAVQQ